MMRRAVLLFFCLIHASSLHAASWEFVGEHGQTLAAGAFAATPGETVLAYSLRALAQSTLTYKTQDDQGARPTSCRSTAWGRTPSAPNRVFCAPLAGVSR